jgi:light-regulated signal transduction histidine kinase (bacteriophytochrome)
LETLVKERTKTLEERNKQLEEYAFYNAHVLRRPISTLLGLYKVYQMEETEEGRQEVLSHLNHVVEELDVVVRQIQGILEIKNDNSPKKF